MPSLKTDSRGRNADGLTSKQYQFCQEFVKDGNATEACVRNGIKRASAPSMGSDLLSRPQVIAEIARLREKVIVKTGKSLEEIAAKIEEIAFAPANSQIADSVDYVKNSDKLKGLELLLRLKGAFAAEKLELSGKDGGPINIAQMSWVNMITQERERIRDSKEAVFSLTDGGNDDPRHDPR